MQVWQTSQPARAAAIDRVRNQQVRDLKVVLRLSVIILEPVEPREAL